MKSLRVLPPTVHVASQDPFELRVEALDAANRVLPPDLSVASWNANAELTLVDAAGDRAYFKAMGSPGSKGVVTATLGTLSAMAQVPIQNASSAIPDWIAGKHADNNPPMLALVDGDVGTNSLSDTLFSFVRSGRMEAFTGGSGNIVVYARHRSVTDALVAFSEFCDQLNLKPITSPPTPAPCTNTVSPVQQDPHVVKVQIFAPGQAGDQPNTGMRYAARVFADAWSGITLNATILDPGLVHTQVQVGLTSEGTCRVGGDPYTDVSWQLENLMHVPAGALKPDVITVAYVDGIRIVPYGLMASGRHCGWDPAKGTIILLDVNGHPLSALAHELGHAFGLGHSDPGEMTVTPEFEPSNLMWGGETDAVLVIRRGLSLGQTYRMTRMAGSFLEHVGAPVTDCQWDNALDKPCPRIRRDIFQR